ncbi:hypothetical protein [Rosistilla ulvae]|uniref:hypothetical protein n=1 Tax=Rosistilla ulvae TaxID=1930277 RepID=UPI0011A1B111|nr:hypothetical protein [Rosistilla ulvae]
MDRAVGLNAIDVPEQESSAQASFSNNPNDPTFAVGGSPTKLLADRPNDARGVAELVNGLSI